MIRVIPLSIDEAEAFFKKHARQYKAHAHPICAIGVKAGVLHGAIVIGRNKNGEPELSHAYSDGATYGYTLLFGAAWKALRALGYSKVLL